MTGIQTTTMQILYQPRRAPRSVYRFLALLLVIGVLSFGAGLAVNTHRAWQMYLVNFLFWSGLAQGGVVMAAVYRITNARWGDQFLRIGEGMISFLPVSLLLFVVMAVGGQELFPWIHEPVPGKKLWLNPYTLFGRDGVIFLFLLWLSYRFVYVSVRPDIGIMKEQGIELTEWQERIVHNWKGRDEETAESRRRLGRLTPGLLVAFGMFYALIGFDLVMALDPQWYSTIYGWMYSLHAFFAALLAITMLAVLSTRWFDMRNAFGVHQWHDMGRFVFGFCLLSGGFFWSQFLVIWYGNLPEETSYLIRRFYSQPWEPLMWVYIIFAYLFPLVVFLSARVKQIPGALFAVVSIIFVALFLERFIAVVPFIWHEPGIPFGLLELGTTLGFAAGFVLCWLAFASRIPLVPAGEIVEARPVDREEAMS